ncbi:MAG: DUF2752 domain-containing protein [Clostridia bacterium]|nr:DUF2752 domain-containing protein [Clostridia bacterium]
MRKFNFKIIAAISPICVLAALFLYAVIAQPFSSSEIFCWVYEKTNICCPSCGLTRAVYSIVQGDFKTAFYYHALFTVGFIPFFSLLTIMGANYALGNKIAWLKYRWIYFYLCLAFVIAFTIYRNCVSFIF